MDIWRWIVDYTETLVERGNVRLARLLIQIPEATCDDRHEEVDALIPEALALVRAEKNAWAEVYVRHWQLQSKVLHRHEVKDCLSEAVQLLEFANRPDTRDCPQSVCVTQDLACTYGDIDGPGYADERLAVAGETLARIDPTWPCFDCISGEYAAALSDQDRIEECLAFIDEQRQKLAAHQLFKLGGNLIRRRSMALFELGRPEEALAQLESWDAHEEGSHRALSERTLRARCMLALGRPDEGRRILPAPSEILPTAGLYEEWLVTVLDFVRAGEVDNDWSLGRVVRSMHRKLDDNGGIYLAAWTAIEYAELAIERGASSLARRSLDIARDRIEALRRPEALLARLASLDRAVADIQPVALDPDIDTPEALLERFGRDPERDIAMARAALERWPGDELTMMHRARTLQVLGWDDIAETELRAFVDACGSAAALEVLGELLIDAGRSGELLELLDQLTGTDHTSDIRHEAMWLRGRVLHSRGDHDRCRAVLRSLLAERPGDRATTMLLAEIERERGAYEEALQLLTAVTRTCEPGKPDWDRMVAATLAGDWDAVRDSARRLGMELDGEGPIDEPGRLCRIRIEDDAGRPRMLYAQRNGPVTARIVEMSGPGDREYYRDVVVFHAAPLNPEADSDDNPVYTYRMLETLTRGGYQSHVLHGAHPGDEEIESLRAALAGLDGVIQLRSDDEYELELPEGEPIRGMYGFLAVPERISVTDVHDLLHRVTSRWAHPIIWPTIADRLDDPRELARQRDVAARYGL